MSQQPDSSLSRLARELLIAERSASEPEALKRRALARARAAFGTGRLGVTEMHVVPAGASAPKRRQKTGVVLAAAAALAIGGMAAAQAGWWETLPVVSSASSIMRPPVRSFPPRPVTMRSALPSVQQPLPVSPLPPRPVTVRSALPSVEQALPVSSPSSPAARLPVASSAAASEQRRSAARQYAAELELLEPARSAIARGDDAAALSAIARHEREFQNGLLTEERSALRVRALWGMGRVAEADAAAKAFRQRYPRSALLGWMRTRHDP